MRVSWIHEVRKKQAAIRDVQVPVIQNRSHRPARKKGRMLIHVFGRVHYKICHQLDIKTLIRHAYPGQMRKRQPPLFQIDKQPAPG